MKSADIILLPNEEARLRKKIRAHFKLLGFLRGPGGILIPPSLEKQCYRDMHEHQRSSRIKKDEPWIASNTEHLIKYFASGSELEVNKIRPQIEIVRSKTWQAKLFRFASYYWRIPISEGYGRRIRFLVWDYHHKKLIGIFALGDAVFNLRARDDLIGWDHHRRATALVNLMDAYALGAVPPYNMLLGGKLVASLIRTKEVVKIFKAKYYDSVGVISGERKNARLAAVTTTSALGRSSIYNRLKIGGTKIFEPVGFTSGWGHFHISDELFNEFIMYLRSVGDLYPDLYKYGQGPNFRLRVVRKVFQLLGINSNMAHHGLHREIFFCPIASNALQFLRGKNKNVYYKNLPTVKQIGDAALRRWVIPRAERMPEYHDWKNEDFLREIEITAKLVPDKLNFSG